MQYKICSICKQQFPLEQISELFNKSKQTKDGYGRHCKKCNNAKKKKWDDNNKEKVKEKNLKYINREHTFIRGVLQRPFRLGSIDPKPLRSGFQRKGRVPEITVPELYGELLLHIQLMKHKFPGSDGKICRYCEQSWTYIRTGSGHKRVTTNFSMDRFDSSISYKKYNIVFCCSKCNTIKGSSGKEQWLQYLKINKEINQEKEQHETQY